MSAPLSKDQQMTEDYADTILATVTRLAKGLNDPDNWKHPDGKKYGKGDEALYEYLNEWPLEVRYEKGEPFSVLVTFGGPNAWLVRDRFGGDRIEVYWGGDHATRRGGSAIPRVLDYFHEYVEEVE